IRYGTRLCRTGTSYPEPIVISPGIQGKGETELKIEIGIFIGNPGEFGRIGKKSVGIRKFQYKFVIRLYGRQPGKVYQILVIARRSTSCHPVDTLRFVQSLGRN